MTNAIRVLHVDDEEGLLDISHALLERHGLDVVTETVPTDALERLAEESIDCVVSDYQMPGMDGLAFLAAVRERWGDVPFVLFTGRGSEEIASDAMAAGVTDYLRKEVGTDQYEVLANRVKRSVNERRVERALAENERLFSAVFNDPVSFIGVLEPDGSLVRANETAMSFVDAEPDDVAGLPFWETPWWQADEAVAALREAVDRANDGEFVRFETVNHGADGLPIWLDVSIRPVRDDDGSVVRIIAEGRDITDRKENERELARYEAIVETTGDLVYVLDREGRIRMLNEAAESITGFDQSSAIGEHVSLVMEDADVETGLALVRSLLADEERSAGTFEMTLPTADGDRIPYETHVSLQYDSDGEFAGSVGVVRDVSERKRRDTQLRQLHEASRELVEAETAEAVAEITAETASDILGYPINIVRLVDEGRELLEPVVVSAETLELFGERPDHPVAGDRPPARAFRTGQLLVVEDPAELPPAAGTAGVSAILYVPLGPHGTLSVASLGGGRFGDAAVKLVTILAANAGVALDRLAERDALETERDHLAALFRNVPDPTIRVEFEDGDPIARDVNPAFEEVFGFARTAVLGRSVDEFIVPVGEEAEAAGYNAGIRQGRSFHGEVRRRTADGIRDFIVHVVPHTVGERSTQGYAIYTDITDQKSRERELERQNERLEEFASVVSHDLRNPLNVAQGHAQLARERGDAEHFETVERAHQRMADLISGLLALAREGEALGETGRVDIEEVLDLAVESVEGPDASLRLRDPPVVVADPNRLSQLFENLLANALEHAGVDVTVTVGALSGGFYVEDDGPGIPESERQRVVESGYSGGGGTGFGLAIVKQIAEAHGWTVTVTESEAGGARFEFTGVAVDDPFSGPA